MLIKLSEDILDRLDIFVLELQEMYIPKPRVWEWMWSVSVFSSWFGIKAVRKNNVTHMKVYATLISCLSLCPIIYCIGYYMPDFWTFLNERSTDNVSEVWRETPLCLPWTLFGFVALQIHLFQLYFSVSLIRAWSTKTRKQEWNLSQQIKWK